MKIPEFDCLPDAVALDLDGTLFNDKESISPRNRAALERCIDLEIPVILATARPTRLFHSVIPDDLVDRVSYTVMNGSVMKGRHPLSGDFKESIDQEHINLILEIARKHYPKINITIEIEGYAFGTNRIIDEDTLQNYHYASPDMVLSVDEALTLEPSKVVLGGIGDEIIRLHEILKPETQDLVSIVPSLVWAPMLNITKAGVSKSHSLRRLLEPVGRSLENTIAFGDDLPDMDMLASCGFGVAMDNALPEVKSCCRYSTATNLEDGVAVVLETLFDL